MPVAVKEIWEVSLRDATGHEQAGRRPAIVLALHQQSNLVMVVPLTSSLAASRFPYTYTISRSTQNGLRRNSIAMIFQLRSLSLGRFRRKMGDLEQNHFDRIKNLVKGYLNL